MQEPDVDLSGPPPASGAGHVVDSSEIIYLIVNALLHTPFAHLGRSLAREAFEARALPERYDFQGRRHALEPAELERRYAHLPPNLLQDALQRLLAINRLRPPHPASGGVRSLLERPPLDLLRDQSSISQAPVPDWLVQRDRPNDCHTKYPDALDLLVREDRGPNAAALPRLPAGPGSLARRFWLTKCLRGHQSVVYCTACNRTATLAITGADDMLVKIWSLMHGQLVASCTGHTAEITDLAVSCDDSLLASGSMDSSVRVWSLKAGEVGRLVAILPEHTQPISTIRWHPSRPDILLTGSFDGTAILWQVAGDAGYCLQVFDASPSSGDHPVSGEEPASTAAHGPQMRSERLARAAAQRTQRETAGAATAAAAGAMAAGNGNPGRPEETIGTRDNMRYPRRTRSAASSGFTTENDDDDGNTAGEQPGGGRQTITENTSDEYPPHAVLVAAFSPCGKHIALATSDGALLCWAETSKADGKMNPHLGVPTSTTNSSSISGTPNNNLLFLDDDQSAGSFDRSLPHDESSSPPPEYELLQRLSNAHGGAIHLLQFSHGGTRFATGSRDGWLRTWRFFERTRWRKVRRGIELEFEDRSERQINVGIPVTQFSWVCDDRGLIYAAEGGALRYIYQDCTCPMGWGIQPIIKHDHGAIHVLECHPFEPALMMTASYSGQMKLWDLKRTEVVFTSDSKESRLAQPNPRGEWPSSLPLTDGRFSADGQTILLSDAGGQLYVYTTLSHEEESSMDVPCSELDQVGDVTPGLAAWRDRSLARRSDKWRYLSQHPMAHTPIDQFLSSDFRAADPEIARRHAEAMALLGPDRAGKPLICDAAGNPYPESFQDAYARGMLRNASSFELPVPERAPGFVEVSPTVLAVVWAAQQRGASQDAVRRAVRNAIGLLQAHLEREEQIITLTELETRGNQPAEIVLEASGPEGGGSANDSDGSIFDDDEAEDGFSSGEDEGMPSHGRRRSRAVDDGRRRSSRIAERRHLAPEEEELLRRRPQGPMTREQQREERAARAQRRQEEHEAQLRSMSRRGTSSRRSGRTIRRPNSLASSDLSDLESEPGRRAFPSTPAVYDDEDFLPVVPFVHLPHLHGAPYPILPVAVIREPQRAVASRPRSPTDYAWLRLHRMTSAFYAPQMGDLVVYFRQLHRVYVEAKGLADDHLSRFPWDSPYADQLCDAEICRVVKVMHTIDEELERTECRLKLQFVSVEGSSIGTLDDDQGPTHREVRGGEHSSKATDFMGKIFDVTIPHPGTGHAEFVVLYSEVARRLTTPFQKGDTVYAFWTEDKERETREDLAAYARMDEGELQKLEPCGSWWKGRVLETKPLRQQQSAPDDGPSSSTPRPVVAGSIRGEMQTDTILVLWQGKTTEQEILVDEGPSERTHDMGQRSTKSLRSQEQMNSGWHSAWELFSREQLLHREENVFFPRADWRQAVIARQLRAVMQNATIVDWDVFRFAPRFTERYISGRGIAEYYNQRVPIPLGFTDIIARLENGHYRSPAALHFDVQCIYWNAYRFNSIRPASGEEDNPIVSAARQAVMEIDYLLRVGNINWELPARCLAWPEPGAAIPERTEEEEESDEWWDSYQAASRRSRRPLPPLSQRDRYDARIGAGPLHDWVHSVDALHAPFEDNHSPPESRRSGRVSERQATRNASSSQRRASSFRVRLRERRQVDYTYLDDDHDHEDEEGFPSFQQAGGDHRYSTRRRGRSIAYTDEGGTDDDNDEDDGLLEESLTQSSRYGRPRRRARRA